MFIKTSGFLTLMLFKSGPVMKLFAVSPYRKEFKKKEINTINHLLVPINHLKFYKPAIEIRSLVYGRHAASVKTSKVD